jgi:hypothetical protein
MRAQAPLKRHGGCRRALIELAQDLLEHAEPRQPRSLINLPVSSRADLEHWFVNCRQIELVFGLIC